jgi:hypothetical protein
MTAPLTSTGLRSSVSMLARRHRGVVGGVAALGATALAVTWLVLVPEKAGDVGPVQSWLLRYAHSVCWALLAVAAGGWAVRAPRRATQWPARAALAAYVTFLAALAL